MKALRNEEKKLRRSYDTGGASDSEDSEDAQPSTMLSLDAVPEDDVKASAWLESPEKMEEDIITGLLEQEFIRSLTKPQLDVYMNCMRGNMSMLSYAKQDGLSFSTVKDTRDAIRKKFKKFLRDPLIRSKNVRCKVKGSIKTASQYLENRISSAADLPLFSKRLAFCRQDLPHGSERSTERLNCRVVRLFAMMEKLGIMILPSPDCRGRLGAFLGGGESPMIPIKPLVVRSIPGAARLFWQGCELQICREHETNN